MVGSNCVLHREVAQSLNGGRRIEPSDCCNTWSVACSERMRGLLSPACWHRNCLDETHERTKQKKRIQVARELIIILSSQDGCSSISEEDNITSFLAKEVLPDERLTDLVRGRLYIARRVTR
jgi:hypothetical protein